MKKWIQSLKDTLHDLGLYYDASYAGDAPDMDRDKEQTAVRPQTRYPDNTKWTKGTPYLYEDKDDGRDWQLYDETKVLKEMTAADFEMIRQYKLRELTYRRIKEVASEADYSNERIAEICEDRYGKHGFALRNVELYMPKIKAASAPLSVGEAAEAPQVTAGNN